MEQEYAPLVILATNRGMTLVRGAGGLRAPHGIPMDLLDRLLIIATEPYTPEDIEKIVCIRAAEEDVALAANAVGELQQIGNRVSLRYAMQLISIAEIVARKRHSATVEAVDIQRAYTLFLDEGRSTSSLSAHSRTMAIDA
jgi:DNA helicase TIP49 (TBP-interacting protein)